MDLNLKQLKFIRGVLSLKRCYKPYEDRGDVNTPKGASAGPSLSPKDNGVSELTIKNAKNTIMNFFML